MATETHSLVTEESPVDTALFAQVTDLLKVSTEAQSTMSETENFQTLVLTGTLAIQYETLVGQMLALRENLERVTLTANHRHWWPRVVTQGSQSEGLYCLRTAIPTATGMCNLFSLKVNRARRTSTHWDEVVNVNTLFPGAGRPHWSYTQVEHQLFTGMGTENTAVATVVTLEDVPDMALKGLPMTDRQLSSVVCVALPQTLAYQVMRNGALPHGFFTNSQINLWFSPRSSLLRLMQMKWSNSIPVTDEHCDEPLILIMFNPELARLSGQTVHTASATDVVTTDGGLHRLLTFNRQWLDHCFSTDSLDADFEMTATERNCAFGIRLNFTLRQLSEVRHELSDYRPFGLHSRGLLGHLILPLSVLKKYDMPMSHCRWTSLYLEDAMDTDEHEMQEVTGGPMDQNDGNGTATVTIGQLPLNHAVTVKVQMN